MLKIILYYTKISKQFFLKMVLPYKKHRNKKFCRLSYANAFICIFIEILKKVSKNFMWMSWNMYFSHKLFGISMNICSKIVEITYVDISDEFGDNSIEVCIRIP